ncbi:MAG TPA: N-acetyl-gamma-glutamyl-phosphate reductase [Polyangiaceae bacterium]
MAARVFIDGHAGTIGLRIRELLASRRDLQVLEISEADRKDPGARRELLNACDVAILCLPDEASVQAVALLENPKVRMIDGSTAFRVKGDWTYGLPELAPEQREAIRAARFVSNPGCWPTCVSLLTRPLIAAGLLPRHAALSIHGVSGYSGGGKSMIARWESPETGLIGLPYEAPYALDKAHKHIPEMQVYGLLEVAPFFRPSVGAFDRGMRVEIPLHLEQLPAGVDARAITDAYERHYAGEQFVRVVPADASAPSSEASLDPRACNGTNRVELRAIQHPQGHVLLVAVLDNLGKGASGAAVQSLNLMLGLPEALGLSAS